MRDIVFHYWDGATSLLAEHRSYDVHRTIEVRRWLESIAVRNTPSFAKRKTRTPQKSIRNARRAANAKPARAPREGSNKLF